VYGLDTSRLYATYFQGDESLGLEADLEARDFWLKYLPEDRVIGCDAKDNFWEVSLQHAAFAYCNCATFFPLDLSSILIKSLIHFILFSMRVKDGRDWSVRSLL